MTDRDHFAAAALTGLLADGGDWRLDYIGRPCIRAYEWADAMLREKERTIHGAAPEARACTDGGSVGTDKAEPLTGDTFSPIAKREADSPQAVVCALNEDEREAVSLAGSRLSADPMYANVCAVLFGLLKRTK